jgi:hypothetical protein
MTIDKTWRLGVVAVVACFATGCSSGVSNCKRNSSDSFRSTGQTLGSWDVIGSVMDVATLPVTTVAGCAKDIAMSPVYEAADKIRMRSVKAEHVAADDPRVKQNAVAISSLKIEPLPVAPPAPSSTTAKCDYRTSCVAAATLLIGPPRSAAAGSRIVIGQEHQQYELTNNCGEQVQCFVCGSKDGKVSRASSQPCDDAASRPLDKGETWIGDGSAENVDGMSLSCLLASSASNPSCTTWPD